MFLLFSFSKHLVLTEIWKHFVKLVSVIFHSLPQCYDYPLRRKTRQRQKHWMEKGNRDRWGKMAIFLVLEVVPSCLLPCLLWAIVKWLASVLLMYMLISAITSRSYKSVKNSAMSGLNTPLLMEKKGVTTNSINPVLLWVWSCCKRSSTVSQLQTILFHRTKMMESLWKIIWTYRWRKALEIIQTNRG